MSESEIADTAPETPDVADVQADESQAAASVETTEVAKPDKARAKLDAAAKQSGWSPKDQWKGDPDDWIDAPEFILKAVGEVLPSMRKTLSDAKTEISTLKRAVNTAVEGMSRAEKRGYDNAVREIQARLDSAAANGDVQGVRDATDEMVELAKEAGAPRQQPEAVTDEHFDTWVSENPWWDSDKVMRAATVAIANELEEETGLKTGPRFFAEVSKRVKEQFPHKFENPNRKLPGVVETPGGAPLKPAGKTFNDLPADAKAMCLDFERDKIMTRAQYVKGYFE